MRNSKLKPEFSPLTLRQECPTTVSDERAASTFTKAMLLLQRITGALLGGVGVTVLIGNLLISSTLLVRGPAFIIGLLAK